MDFIGRLVSHLNPNDPNVIFFLDYIIPEIERGDRIYNSLRRHVKYLCPICLVETKRCSEFINHLQSVHSDKLPENGQIFKILEDESNRMKAEQLRIKLLTPIDPALTHCFVFDKKTLESSLISDDP